jgi:hypothetical protein
MAFWNRDHRVSWQGLAAKPSPTLATTVGDTWMQAVLDEFAAVFADP